MKPHSQEALVAAPKENERFAPFWYASFLGLSTAQKFEEMLDFLGVKATVVEDEAAPASDSKPLR